MKLLHSKGQSLGKKHVLVAVPSYGGMPPELVYSLWGSVPFLTESNIGHDLLILSGGCHVDDNRNHIMQVFLESSCTDLVMIDNDMRFSPQDLVALVEYNEDIIAGVGSKKSYPLDFACRFNDEELIPGKLMKVDGVGAAFIKISRNAASKLADSSIKYTSQVSGRCVEMPLVFERTVEDGRRWGGDYSFCNKWKSMGGKIYVDPEIILGHIGQNEWVGSLGSHIRKKNGGKIEFIKHILDKISHGNETARDYVQLVNEWDNDYSSDESLLYVLTLLARECRGKILECGSGVSTILLAAIGCDVVSLEHSEEWASKISESLIKIGLKSRVVWSPLNNLTYTVVPEEKYSIVFIDGPPRGISDRSLIVDMVLPLEDCIWVVDDFDDHIKTKITKRFGVVFNDFGRFTVGRKQ